MGQRWRASTDAARNGDGRDMGEHDEQVGRSGESFLDDTDSGSDVELRRMGEAPGKRSASL